MNYDSERMGILYRMQRNWTVTSLVSFWADVVFVYFLYTKFGQPWWWWTYFILFLLGWIGAGFRSKRIGKAIDEALGTKIER